MQSQRWMLDGVQRISPRLLERSDWIPQVIHGWVLTGEMNRVGTLTPQGASACYLTGGGKVSKTQSGAFFFPFLRIDGQYLARVPALFRIFGSRLCRKTRRLGRGQSMGSERKDGPEAGRAILIEWLPLLPLDCPPFGVRLLSVT